MTTHSLLSYPIIREKVANYAKKDRQSRRSPCIVAVFFSEKPCHAQFGQGADSFRSGISDFAG